jgi:hypothetical protein
MDLHWAKRIKLERPWRVGFDTKGLVSSSDHGKFNALLTNGTLYFLYLGTDIVSSFS